MQKLILPLNDTQALAGYQNSAYQKAWGRPHYGVDHWSATDRTVWAMGDGEVVAAGMDNVYGGCAVVIYKDVYVHATGRVMDLVARCYHMAKLYCKAGDKVTTAKKIGVMGNTGQYTSGEHLHIEFDTDTKWPTYTIELKNNSNIMKKGTGADTTIDPAGVLHVKASAPDNQRIVANESYAQRGYLNAWDVSLPDVSEPTAGEISAEYAVLRAAHEELQGKYEALSAEHAEGLGKISALEERYEALVDGILALIEKNK